jgi:hypothetical protein
MQQTLGRAIRLCRDYGLGAVEGCAGGHNTTGRDTGLSLSFTMNASNFAGSVALACLLEKNLKGCHLKSGARRSGLSRDRPDAARQRIIS